MSTLCFGPLGKLVPSILSERKQTLEDDLAFSIFVQIYCLLCWNFAQCLECLSQSYLLLISLELATFSLEIPFCKDPLYPIVSKLLPSSRQPFLLLAEYSSNVQQD